MFSGFQSNALQRNAFQIGGGSPSAGTTTQPSGGWYIYPTPRIDALKNLKLSEKRRQLKRIDNEMALRAREANRLEERKALAAHIEAALEAEQETQIALLKQEINRLRMERVWLMRIIDDEEAVLALLLSTPLH